MPADLVETMTAFARTLRAAGVDADPVRVHTLVNALGHLDVLDPAQVYWAGRVTLCARFDDIERYDRCFAAYFSGATAPPRQRQPRVTVIQRVALPDDASQPDPGGRPETQLATASPVEVLRHRDVSRLSAAEREEVARMLALLRAGGAQRRTRRLAAASRGRLDPQRTVRAALRRGGEVAVLHRRAARRKPRRVVLLLDVSGSMAAYADTLLRFAHAMVRAQPRATQVFTIGTRLTQITRELLARDADLALRACSSCIPDWSGGTRLGAEIKEFLDLFGQRGMARGAIVVLASDGWERGSATLLGVQMARLHRLAHRVIWVNPHKAQEGYEPLTAGMAAALPHIDDFVAGHSLAALEELATLIRGRT